MLFAGSLIEQLTTEKYECMVCCEVVRIVAPVWSCQNCYHVFHLNCIKKWARSPASQAEGWYFFKYIYFYIFYIMYTYSIYNAYYMFSNI